MLVKVKVIPRAKKDEIFLDEGGELKVRLSVPPVDGKANVRLVKLLSEYFGVPKKNIVIVKGEKSRNKLVEVEGV